MRTITYQLNASGYQENGDAKFILSIASFLKSKGQDFTILEVTFRSITLRTLKNRAKETADGKKD